MANRFEKLRDAINSQHPKSRIAPLTSAQHKKLLSRYPKLPAHLRDFFAIVGAGTIGDSDYMVYPLILPTDIFDKETAEELDGVVLVGDDFAGTHEAYDTASRPWTFGRVSASGTFVPHEVTNFVEFLQTRLGR